MTQNKSVNPPNLSSLLDSVKRDSAMAINCIQIGEIQSFDKETQLASVSIAMKQVVGVAEDGTRTLEDYPLLLECPVFTLQGGRDYIGFPISKGDFCIILFNDRQIDEWLNFGSGRPPTVGRVHDLSDGMAIVGLNSLGSVLSGLIDNGIIINHGGGNSKIELTNDLIKLSVVLAQFTQDVRIERNLAVGGNVSIAGEASGNGSGNLVLNANLIQTAGRELHAGNGATGTFGTVNVVNGIVIGGTAV